jgi:hypothetical protein
MGYFVTDPSLIALANAGLPPDEQVGAYYQMDEHEIARAAATRGFLFEAAVIGREDRRK